MYQVLKRDGKVVDFDIAKISEAIKMAFADAMHYVTDPRFMKVDYNDYTSLPTDGLTFLNERMWIQCYAWQFVLRRELALQERFTPGIYFEDTDWTPRMLLRAERVASTSAHTADLMSRRRPSLDPARTTAHTGVRPLYR